MFLKYFPEVSCRGNALGMEDNTINGGGIVASSWYSPYIQFLPFQGRLNNPNGTWCSKSSDNDSQPYLQVRERLSFPYYLLIGHLYHGILYHGIWHLYHGNVSYYQDHDALSQLESSTIS